MLTLIAMMNTEKENLELVKEALRELVESTRKEAGCIHYDLHQDKNNELCFIFHESWESRELWQAHNNGDALKAFREKLGAAKPKTEVFQLTKIA